MFSDVVVTSDVSTRMEAVPGVLYGQIGCTALHITVIYHIAALAHIAVVTPLYLNSHSTNVHDQRRLERSNQESHASVNYLSQRT